MISSGKPGWFGTCDGTTDGQGLIWLGDEFAAAEFAGEEFALMNSPPINSPTDQFALDQFAG